jgi:hypothetical protein
MSDKSDESNPGFWVGVVVIALVLYCSNKCGTSHEEYRVVPIRDPASYYPPLR